MKEEKKEIRIDWKNKGDMKLCYSISEVAQMYGLSEVTLRYWEREGAFTPRRTGSGGNRYYHREHLIVIDKLNHLIYRKGLTLKAALLRLKDESTSREIEVIDRLRLIRERLRTLSDSAEELLKGE